MEKFAAENPTLTIRVERPADESFWWCFIAEGWIQDHRQLKASHFAETPEEAATGAIKKYHEDEDRLITDLRHADT